mmetsp:Transcript_114978/g.273416  ORF Transcript_114978/g.273416 Transcript_114978/m.273416 type:complete len:222 (-) Transcript_114978:787-1452(-)
MSLLSVLLSSVSFAMEAFNVSISDCKDSEVSVFSSRVALLVASSVTHQVFFVASSLACSFNLVRSCWIIFFTLPSGSAPTRTARADSMRLFRAEARCWRKRATWSFRSPWLSDRRKASTEPRGERCKSPGRCFSALPATEPLEMISCALPTASISSCRVFWRSEKAAAFFAQVAFRSFANFSSASFSALVSARSPSDDALLCTFLALNCSLELFSFFDSLI